MAEYIVQLPQNIPEELFEVLSGAHNGIRAKIRTTYGQLEKVASTNARNREEAIRNIISRQVDSQSVGRKSLIKMFNCASKEYAFEIPKKEAYDLLGKRIPDKTAETFQTMELAIEIAETMNEKYPRIAYGPKDFHDKACALLKAYKENKKNYSRQHENYR